MKKILTLTIALATGLLLGTTNAKAVQAGSETGETREYMVKAAFLYNFAKFTDWPTEAFASPDAPLRLCILGRNPFGHALDMIRGKSVGRHPIEIRFLSKSRVAATCHILFLSASETDRLPLILKYLRDRPVLTVSEAPNFTKSGGIIRLKTVRNKIRFEINPAVAQNAGLAISSRLLKLAANILPRLAVANHTEFDRMVAPAAGAHR